jgi:DNA-binding transcriptional regulator YdaS (Cro superfamily)
MELAELVELEGGQAKFAKRIGCSKSYLNHVLKGRKAFGPALAIKVFKATGKKLGPMAKGAN